MGERGREHVKKNFLTVGNLKDYLQLFIELEEVPPLHEEEKTTVPVKLSPEQNLIEA